MNYKKIILEVLKENTTTPTRYHFICYGGGSCSRRLDEWSDKNTITCKHQGDKNWMVPACEKCNGLSLTYKSISDSEESRNCHMREFAFRVIKRIEDEASRD